MVKILSNYEQILASTTEEQSHKNTKIYEETLSRWREKLGDKLRIISLYQIEITTLIDTTRVKKNSIFYFLLPSLFFSSLSLALIQAILQDCTNPQSHLLGLLFSLGLHILTPSGVHLFNPSSLAEWPLYLFLHLFLLFSLSLSSYQVTINASHLLWLCFNQNLFLLVSLAEWPCLFLLFLPSHVSHKFNITYSFMWLGFCTSLHKCCWTFVHNYRGKDEPNCSHLDKLLQQTHFTLLTSLHLSNKLI